MRYQFPVLTFMFSWTWSKYTKFLTIYDATNFFVSSITISLYNVKVINKDWYSGFPEYKRF